MYRELCLLLVLVTATGAARLPFIHGGQDVNPVGKWPWQGAVEFLGLPLCGCVVLSSKWLLSTSSCFILPELMNVILGAHDILTKEKGKPTSHSIDLVIKHPDFSFDFNVLDANDIGLIKLCNPADLSTPHIGAATLVPADNTDVFSDCYMTGWGATWDDAIGPDSLFHNVLQEAKVSVITNEACETAWEDAREKPGVILDTNICVLGSAPSATGECVSDGGGPVTCSSDGTWLLVGIMVHPVFECAQYSTYPTICTRVSKYREWIAEATNGDVPMA